MGRAGSCWSGRYGKRIEKRGLALQGLSARAIWLRKKGLEAGTLTDVGSTSKCNFG
jgi:hypothetical protein